MIIILILGLVGVAVVLTVWVLPWLRENKKFGWFEPYAITLFRKSETIFWARFNMFLGCLLTFLTHAKEIDLTPLLPLIPDRWEPLLLAFWNTLPMLVSLLGWITEQQRRETTEPLAVTAAPEAVKIALPEIAEMKQAKVAAVAAVEEAEAAGKS